MRGEGNDTTNSLKLYREIVGKMRGLVGEGDPRVTTLLKWFSEEAYPKRYGVTYFLNYKKEGALLKSSLRYFDQYKDQAENEFKDAATHYLENPDPYLVEHKHPLATFLSKPHVFMKKRAAPKREENSFSVFDFQLERIKVEKRWSGDGDEWVQKTILKMGENPVRSIKAFFVTEGYLRAAAPKRWKAITEGLREMIGAARFKKAVEWAQKEKIFHEYV